VIGRTPAAAPVAGQAGGATPRWLWVAAAGILLPTAVPLGALVIRIAGDRADALRLLWTPRTAELLINTIALVGSVTLAAGVVGIGAAWLTTRTDLPGRRVWAVTAALPLVIPSYVIAMALRSASGPRGMLAEITGIGFPSIEGFTGAWLALTIATYPFIYLVAAAALLQSGRAQEEAAGGLGASRWRVFRTVILPRLRPSVAAGALLAALYTLSDFGAVSLMRFDAFTRVVYAQYAGRLDRTPAAVLAVALAGLAILVLAAEQRTRGRGAHHTSTPDRPAAKVHLSGWARTIAIGAMALLATVALVLPIGVLVAWLARNGDITIPWGAVAGSLTGSSLAALLATAAAIPVSVLVVRHRSRAGAWVERASYALFALPHLTVALAVVFFAANYLGGLYRA